MTVTNQCTDLMRMSTSGNEATTTYIKSSSLLGCVSGSYNASETGRLRVQHDTSGIWLRDGNATGWLNTMNGWPIPDGGPEVNCDHHRPLGLQPNARCSTQSLPTCLSACLAKQRCDPAIAIRTYWFVSEREPAVSRRYLIVQNVLTKHLQLARFRIAEPAEGHTLFEVTSRCKLTYTQLTGPAYSPFRSDW
jgi:hypothetical protein